jgi:hypothetical protein
MDSLPITLVAGELALIVGACAWILVSWRRHRRFSLRALLFASQRLAMHQIRGAGGEVVFREEWGKTVHRLFAASDRQAFVIAEELERLPQYRKVVLSSVVTDSGLKAICETRQPLALEELWLQSELISSLGLKHLAKLQRLESLHFVTTTRIDDTGIAHLKDVPGLQSVCIVDSWKPKGSKPLLGVETFAEFGALEQLTLLDLRYGGREPLYISDAALNHLHRLTRLETLWLRLRGIIVPSANAAEAAVVEEIDVIAVDSLSQTVAFLAGNLEIEPTPSRLNDLFNEFSHYEEDFADVRGQEMAKRAVAIAAAGSHNLLTFGPITPTSASRCHA